MLTNGVAEQSCPATVVDEVEDAASGAPCSVAVNDWTPAVWNATLKVWMPWSAGVKVYVSGRVAALSEEENATCSMYPVIVEPFASRAVMVTGTTAPGCTVAGALMLKPAARGLTLCFMKTSLLAPLRLGSPGSGQGTTMALPV